MFCNRGTTKIGILPALDAPATAVTAHAAGEAHSSNRVARHVAGVTFDVCPVCCAAVPGRIPPPCSSMRGSRLMRLPAGRRCFVRPAAKKARRHACTDTVLPHGAQADLMRCAGERMSLYACRTCDVCILLVRGSQHSARSLQVHMPYLQLLHLHVMP